MGFVPIRLEDYVAKFLASNPGEKRLSVTERLKAMLSDNRAGVRCACGDRIWVIGSAEVGRGCFTCITGEANPDGDYELAEACESPSELGSRRKYRRR